MYCLATCHCQQHKNIESFAEIILWQIYVAGNNKIHLSFHVKSVPDIFVRF
jgi:hypothetical protein